MLEIERKFLVNSENFPRTGHAVIMKQAYLSVDPERIVRVRTEGNQAWLTIKGGMKGITRTELEYAIPPEHAAELFRLALNPPVEKIRHRVDVDGILWEVDEFLGLNSGLILAEVELDHETQQFSLPDWVGREVTADHRFYNNWLSVHPFTTWGEDA